MSTEFSMGEIRVRELSHDVASHPSRQPPQTAPALELTSTILCRSPLPKEVTLPPGWDMPFAYRISLEKPIASVDR
jgi:hypothetical protein